MRIMQLIFPKNNPPSFLRVVFFLVLSVLQPQAAHAQVAPAGLPVSDIAAQFNMFMNAINAAANQVITTFTHQLNSEFGIRIGQAQVDATYKAPYLQMAGLIVPAYSPVPTAKFCPRAALPGQIISAHNAGESMKAALQSAIALVGAGAATPAGKVAIFKQMCNMSLIKDAQFCPNPPYPQYADDSVWQSYAIANGNVQIQWPSNLTVNQTTGVAQFTGTPQQADMPGIRAIFYCALMQPPTGVPINAAQASTGQATVQYVTTLMDQKRAQGLANVGPAACVDYLADRMAVGQSASGSGLQAVYNAEFAVCQQMQDSTVGTMSAADFSSCQQNGLSDLNRRQHEACPGPNKLNAQAQNGESVDQTNPELDKLSDRCEEFLMHQQEKDAHFKEIMASQQVAPNITPDVSARPVSQ